MTEPGLRLGAAPFAVYAVGVVVFWSSSARNANAAVTARPPRQAWPLGRMGRNFTRVARYCRAMSLENVEIVPGARVALPHLSERARQRRTLDQRLILRFPAFYRRLSAIFMRLPPRSRLRRLMLARAVGLAYAAANRRDFDLVLVGWDLGSEYHPSGDLLPPDLEAVFYGHDGYRQLWRYWLDAFDDIRWDPEEILDFGDRFLVTTQQSGRGSGSGVAVGEPVFQLFTLRAGLVVRQEDFLDRSKALEAASPGVNPTNRDAA